MASAKSISLNEVSKHRSQKSLWIIINNDVLDVTKFMDEHPGGADTLMEVAGTDATQAFNDVGHSSDARSMLKKYKIGSLPPHERMNAHSHNCCTLKPGKKDSCPGQAGVSNIRSPRSEKTWRTYDGSPSSRSLASRSSRERRPELCPGERVSTIIVPQERPPKKKKEPEEGSSNLKWMLLLLGAVVVLGFAYKKYSS